MPEPQILIETGDVRARIMTLPAGESTPLHFHTEVTDHMVCLTGSLWVEMQDPDEVVTLAPGQHCVVDRGRRHRVCNPDVAHAARYLLLQGIGKYDFITNRGSSAGTA